MRILVNGLSARLGGGQTYLINLLSHISPGSDWEVFLLCQHSLVIDDLPPNVRRFKTKINLENPIKRAVWELLFINRIIKKNNIEIYFSPGGLLPVVRLPSNIKSVVTFQNMLPFDMEQRKRYPLGYRRIRDWLLERGLSNAMKKADLIIFISEFAKKFILNRLEKIEGKSVVIPHGLSQQFFPHTEKNSKIPTVIAEYEYFLYVSFIDYYKSQIEVVQAFAELKNKTKTSAKLILVGAENHPYGLKLRQEISRLGLEDFVKILGNLPHNDLPYLYQNALINLFASCTENCPNILLEIMASGRPALVSNYEPMPEFAGSTVTYFDPKNHTDLVEQWAALLLDMEYGLIQAKSATDRVSNMKWENTGKLTWLAIASLLASDSVKA
jgi:glycosyltransferase involved in cell wall biosynthesis